VSARILLKADVAEGGPRGAAHVHWPGNPDHTPSLERIVLPLQPDRERQLATFYQIIEEAV